MHFNTKTLFLFNFILSFVASEYQDPDLHRTVWVTVTGDGKLCSAETQLTFVATATASLLSSTSKISNTFVPEVASDSVHQDPTTSPTPSWVSLKTSGWSGTQIDIESSFQLYSVDATKSTPVNIVTSKVTVSTPVNTAISVPVVEASGLSIQPETDNRFSNITQSEKTTSYGAKPSAKGDEQIFSTLAPTADTTLTVASSSANYIGSLATISVDSNHSEKGQTVITYTVESLFVTALTTLSTSFYSREISSTLISGQSTITTKIPTFIETVVPVTISETITTTVNSTAHYSAEATLTEQNGATFTPYLPSATQVDSDSFSTKTSSSANQPFQNSAATDISFPPRSSKTTVITSAVTLSTLSPIASKDENLTKPVNSDPSSHSVHLPFRANSRLLPIHLQSDTPVNFNSTLSGATDFNPSSHTATPQPTTSSAERATTISSSADQYFQKSAATDFSSPTHSSKTTVITSAVTLSTLSSISSKDENFTKPVNSDPSSHPVHLPFRANSRLLPIHLQSDTPVNFNSTVSGATDFNPSSHTATPRPTTSSAEQFSYGALQVKSKSGSVNALQLSSSTLSSSHVLSLGEFSTRNSTVTARSTDAIESTGISTLSSSHVLPPVEFSSRNSTVTAKSTDATESPRISTLSSSHVFSPVNFPARNSTVTAKSTDAIESTRISTLSTSHVLSPVEFSSRNSTVTAKSTAAIESIRISTSLSQNSQSTNVFKASSRENNRSSANSSDSYTINRSPEFTTSSMSADNFLLTSVSSSTKSSKSSYGSTSGTKPYSGLLPSSQNAIQISNKTSVGLDPVSKSTVTSSSNLLPQTTQHTSAKFNFKSSSVLPDSLLSTNGSYTELRSSTRSLEKSASLNEVQRYPFSSGVLASTTFSRSIWSSEVPKNNSSINRLSNTVTPISTAALSTIQSANNRSHFQTNSLSLTIALPVENVVQTNNGSIISKPSSKKITLHNSLPTISSLYAESSSSERFKPQNHSSASEFTARSPNVHTTHLSVTSDYAHYSISPIGSFAGTQFAKISTLSSAKKESPLSTTASFAPSVFKSSSRTHKPAMADQSSATILNATVSKPEKFSAAITYAASVSQNSTLYTSHITSSKRSESSNVDPQGFTTKNIAGLSSNSSFDLSGSSTVQAFISPNHRGPTTDTFTYLTINSRNESVTTGRSASLAQNTMVLKPSDVSSKSSSFHDSTYSNTMRTAVSSSVFLSASSILRKTTSFSAITSIATNFNDHSNDPSNATRSSQASSIVELPLPSNGFSLNTSVSIAPKSAQLPSDNHFSIQSSVSPQLSSISQLFNLIKTADSSYAIPSPSTNASFVSDGVVSTSKILPLTSANNSPSSSLAATRSLSASAISALLQTNSLSTAAPSSLFSTPSIMLLHSSSQITAPLSTSNASNSISKITSSAAVQPMVSTKTTSIRLITFRSSAAIPLSPSSAFADPVSSANISSIEALSSTSSSSFAILLVSSSASSDAMGAATSDPVHGFSIPTASSTVRVTSSTSVAGAATSDPVNEFSIPTASSTAIVTSSTSVVGAVSSDPVNEFSIPTASSTAMTTSSTPVADAVSSDPVNDFSIPTASSTAITTSSTSVVGAVSSDPVNDFSIPTASSTAIVTSSTSVAGAVSSDPVNDFSIPTASSTAIVTSSTSVVGAVSSDPVNEFSIPAASSTAIVTSTTSVVITAASDPVNGFSIPTASSTAITTSSTPVAGAVSSDPVNDFSIPTASSTAITTSSTSVVGAVSSDPVNDFSIPTASSTAIVTSSTSVAGAVSSDPVNEFSIPTASSTAMTTSSTPVADAVSSDPVNGFSIPTASSTAIVTSSTSVAGAVSSDPVNDFSIPAASSTAIVTSTTSVVITAASDNGFSIPTASSTAVVTSITSVAGAASSDPVNEFSIPTASSTAIVTSSTPVAGAVSSDPVNDFSIPTASSTAITTSSTSVVGAVSSDPVNDFSIPTASSTAIVTSSTSVVGAVSSDPVNDFSIPAASSTAIVTSTTSVVITAASDNGFSIPTASSTAVVTSITSVAGAASSDPVNEFSIPTASSTAIVTSSTSVAGAASSDPVNEFSIPTASSTTIATTSTSATPLLSTSVYSSLMQPISSSIPLTVVSASYEVASTTSSLVSAPIPSFTGTCGDENKAGSQCTNGQNSNNSGSDSGQNINNQGSDNQGSNNQGSDSQGSDSQGSDSQGSDSQGSDSQGSNNQGSDSQGSDSQGSDSQGSNNQGSDSQGPDNHGSENQDSDNQGSTNQDSNQNSDNQGSNNQGSNDQGSNDQGSNDQGSDGSDDSDGYDWVWTPFIWL